MLGQIFLAVIVTISVLGMTSIIISFFVPDKPVYQEYYRTYTNCTKPQQASSGVPTKLRKKPQNNSAILYAGTHEESRKIPQLKQGQNNPLDSFIAKAEDFLDEDDDFDIDEGLMD